MAGRRPQPPPQAHFRHACLTAPRSPFSVRSQHHQATAPRAFDRPHRDALTLRPSRKTACAHTHLTPKKKEKGPLCARQKRLLASRTLLPQLTCSSSHIQIPLAMLLCAQSTPRTTLITLIIHLPLALNTQVVVVVPRAVHVLLAPSLAQGSSSSSSTPRLLGPLAEAEGAPSLFIHTNQCRACPSPRTLP